MRQAQQFPNALNLIPSDSLEKVVLSEAEKGSTDKLILYGKAEKLLMDISNPTNAEYILDRLDFNDIYTMVNTWDALMKKIKEQFVKSGLDKNLFIQSIHLLVYVSIYLCINKSSM